MDNTVIFHEWIPYRKLPEYVSLADICILPAYNNKIMNEIVPIKLYEYLAMEKPVISTFLNGIFLEFKKGNGIVYIKSSKNTVDKAINMWKSNIIAKLGRSGRKFVLENCNWENLLAQFISICKSIKLP